MLKVLGILLLINVVYFANVDNNVDNKERLAAYSTTETKTVTKPNHYGIARYMCARSVEKLSTYGYEWDYFDGPSGNESFTATSSMLNGNAQAGDIVFNGTSVKFKNAFGTDKRKTFTCVYDKDTVALTFLNVH